MDRHESRDLDGVIDDVARAMTGAELARDLRPAVASRIARTPSWTIGWRAGVAAIGLAAVVLVAVVLRPTPEPQRLPTVAGGGVHATVRAPVPVEDQAPAPRRAARAVARQTLIEASAIATDVNVAPLAVVPLDADSLEPLDHVEIAPIDIEPVRLSQLELIEWRTQREREELP